MYIVKNAFRSISRSKGRNILIGMIVLIIALSSCVALSIRQAAESARESGMESLEVTGQISVNRQQMMNDAENQTEMKEKMLEAVDADLSLEEQEEYAQNEHVKSFYYTSSVSMNGGDIEAVDTTGTGEDTESAGQEMPGMGGQNTFGDDSGGGRMGVQGDFTVIGYSSDEAMTDFTEGTSSVSEGSMFPEGDTQMQCIVNSEMATYNDLSVGDALTLVNPNNESETFTFTVCGIYEKESGEDSFSGMMGGFSAAFDSANQIYTSYDNVESMVTQSEETAGSDTDTALFSQESGTYVFADVESYEAFAEEVGEELGDEYTISSTDLDMYEQSLQPLENLSKYAGYFLIVILVIGGAILIVLNLFHIRERKYEIGVLAAIGMKKGKIAAQFLLETLCVTFCAIILGAIIGAVTSVPLTNALLAQQNESSVQKTEQTNMNFGREFNGGEQAMEMPDDVPDDAPDDGGGFAGGKVEEYVSQVQSATDFTVVLQLMGIGILLTVISGGVAMVSILRYDPLKILSNRE